MPLFEKNVDVPLEKVSAIVADNWNLLVISCLKKSQNHTFDAKDNAGTRFVVRVTPDADGSRLRRIEQEVFFVNFIADQAVDHVCAYICTKNGSFIYSGDGVVVVVSRWALGSPIDFMSYTWMTDRDMVVAWGRWLGSFHQASRRFSEAHPGAARAVQRWDEVHSGVMAGAAVHATDLRAAADPRHYGVLHGDLNCSNFYYDHSKQLLSVYDWDQTQQGWFMWDVAQSELAVHMLAEGGSVVDGSPVPEADPAAFNEWIVEGYESVTGVGSVDRDMLSRMVQLRKSFYERFCRRAEEEGDVPPDMAPFISCVVKWFDKMREGRGMKLICDHS